MLFYRSLSRGTCVSRLSAW